MFRNMFANMPDVVKNLVIINALFFLATVILEFKGINLMRMLGVYYPASPLFKPYQLATHFFMHGGFFHILFNMFALVIFGSQLERVWGPKRFLLFYFITAFGAVLLHFSIEAIEIYRITGEVFPDVYSINVTPQGDGMVSIQVDPSKYTEVGSHLVVPTLGASGAVYGVLAAFAMLFPNTRLMLLFPPIPIKAKWLALGLAAIALYSGWQRAPGDSIAHFAHLGGMLFGFILVKIWQKNNTDFY